MGTFGWENTIATLLPPLPTPLSHPVLLTGESFLLLHPLCRPHLPLLQTAVCHWGTDTPPAPATPPDFIFLHLQTCSVHHHQLPLLLRAPCSASPAQPGQSDQSSHSFLLLPCAGSIQTLCQLLPAHTQTTQGGGNLFFTPFYTYCGEVLISGWSQ